MRFAAVAIRRKPKAPSNHLQVTRPAAPRQSVTDCTIGHTAPRDEAKVTAPDFCFNANDRRG
jgi:hypothetical protein